MIKNNKTLLIIGIIIIGILLIKYSQLYTIVIRYGELIYPPEQRDVIWLENNIKLIAPTFDSLSCSNQKQFCGCDDGEITISNSYEAIDNLTLTSSISGIYMGCGGNYLNGETNLPSGTLKAVCKIDMSVQESGTSSSCSVNTNNGNFVFSASKSVGSDSDKGSFHFEDTKTIILNNSSNIIINLTTSTAAYSSVQTKLILSFKVKEIICIENWVCSSWGTCLNNIQIRNCIDSNNCNTLIGKPSENQSCTITPPCVPLTQTCSDGNIIVIKQCVNNAWVSTGNTCITCTSNCNNRECGNDGCGGSCGTCDSDKICSSNGKCESIQTTIQTTTQTTTLTPTSPSITSAKQYSGTIIFILIIIGSIIFYLYKKGKLKIRWWKQ